MNLLNESQHEEIKNIYLHAQSWTIQELSLQKGGYYQRPQFAYDQTFILPKKVISNNRHVHIFLHLDKNKELISQLPIQAGERYQMKVVNQDELIIFTQHTSQSRMGALIYCNLRNGSNTQTTLQLMNNPDWLNSQNIAFFFFRKTQTICICQCFTKEGKQVTNLSYFSLPLLEKAQPIKTYTFYYKQAQEKTPYPQKLNQYSMIGFIEQKNKKTNQLGLEQLTLYTYSLDNDKLNGQLAQINIKLNITIRNYPNLNCQISYIRQIKPLVFFIQYRVEIQSIKIFEKIQKQGKINEVQRSHNFLWDQNKKTIQIYTFNPPQFHQLQFVNSMQTLIDKHCLFKIARRQNILYKFFNNIENFQLLKGPQTKVQYQNTYHPIYFIEPYSNQILATYNHNKFSSEIRNNMIIEKISDQRPQYETFKILRLPIRWYALQQDLTVIGIFMINQIIIDFDIDLAYQLANIIRNSN